MRPVTETVRQPSPAIRRGTAPSLHPGRHPSLKRGEATLGIVLILPAVLLICGVIVYPIFYNTWLSFFRVSLNPDRPNRFLGLANYLRLFTDPDFYRALATTGVYVVTTVVGSTVTGLLVALLMNRRFAGRGIARSLVILPYVAPVISLVFTWRYLFNSIYGFVNYLLVDLLHVFEESPAWFDHPVYSVAVVFFFDSWRVAPYAFMMILAALQAIDASLYEAAEVDGAGPTRRFFAITLPSIMPVIGSIAILRTIWNFYKFDDVYLLTRKVPIIGIYLYETAFAVNDHGMAAAITVVLFVIVMTFVVLLRRKVFQR